MSEEDYSEAELKFEDLQSMKRSLDLIMKDLKAAKWAIIFIIVYFALLRRFTHGLCPVVAFCGYPCPACGLTRAGLHLLHLEFAKAWRMHPFIYAVLLLAVFFCVNRYFLEQRRTEQVKWLAILIIGGMVCFYFYRMFRYFPGASPMSFYRKNLIHLLFVAIKGIT